MAPTIWLILALAAATPITYGVMWVKREIATKAAYDKGYDSGKASVSAATVEGATRTAAAERQAETEVAHVSPEREAIIARCKKTASCRERGTLK